MIYRSIENQISGIADHQCSVMKRSYDRDKKLNERFDDIDGTLGILKFSQADTFQ